MVMVCVSDTPDVEAVVFGPKGIAEGLSEGGLVIDHSTISPKATKEFATAVNKLGATWLDAPISGGSEGAAQGHAEHHDRRRRRPDRTAPGNTSRWWAPPSPMSGPKVQANL